MNISDQQREVIRQALVDIGSENHGVLNPRDVVEVARDPSHVLHPKFEWDDGAAGDAYRIVQASALIRQMRLTIIRTDAETRSVTVSTTRQYQSRPSMRFRMGGYEVITHLLADTNKRQELLAQVLTELNAYRKRFAELSELESVWFAVDEATAELRTETPSPSAADGEARPGAAG
jgi:hypothetical protein